jgi:Cu-Zn family superoxide dismutase
VNGTGKVGFGLWLAAGLCGLAPSRGAEPAAPAPRATATIEPRSGSRAHGTASFVVQDGAVTLRLRVEGATPGPHALHLHEKGDCSAPDASSAGAHFNPGQASHGRWGHPPHHLGDIGNIEIGQDGAGSLVLTTDRWSIGTGRPDDIAGRSVILHEGVDDFTSQPTGNAGGRIGCGVIRLE